MKHKRKKNELRIYNRIFVIFLIFFSLFVFVKADIVRIVSGVIEGPGTLVVDANRSIIIGDNPLTTTQYINQYTVEHKGGNESLADVNITTLNDTATDLCIIYPSAVIQAQSIDGIITIVNLTGNVTQSPINETPINETPIVEEGLPPAGELPPGEIGGGDLNVTPTGNATAIIYNYTVPLVIPITLNENELIVDDVEVIGDARRFCFTANSLTDRSIKFGENSILIVQDTSVSANTILSNITIENTTSGFIHLTTNDPSLIAYYPFDADTASKISNFTYDFTTNNMDGIYLGGATTNANCIYDNCAGFDGVNDVINVTSLNMSYNGTISMWVNANVNNTAQYLFSNIGTGALQNRLYVMINTTGGLIAMIGNNPGFGNTPIATNNWYHVALTYRFNSSNINGTFYVNGIQVGNNYTLFNPSNFYNPAYNKISLGAYGGGSNSFLNGSIDDVMIFNKSLTAEEVLAIYNNQSQRFYSVGEIEMLPSNVTTNNNRANVSFVDFRALFGTNVSLRLGEWNITLDYNYTYPKGQINYYTYQNSTVFNPNTPVCQNSTFSLSQFPLGSTIYSTTYNKTIAFGIGGYSAYLISPLGTTINICDLTNTDGDMGCDTTVVDFINITSAFNGENANGDWIQEVCNSGFTGDTGHWGLNITTSQGVILMLTNESIVGYWNFDNISAYGENQTFFYDRTGQNNFSLDSGTGPVPNYTDGFYEKGIKFNAISEDNGKRFVTKNADNCRFTNLSCSPKTISFWMNPYNVSGYVSVVMGTMGYASSSGGWFIQYGGGTSQNVAFGWTNKSTLTTVSSAFLSVPIGNWSYITILANETNVTLYVNGIPRASKASPVPMFNSTMVNARNNLTIGASIISFNDPYNGTIDELIIYNKTLSDAEIKSLYIKGLANWNYTEWKNMTPGTNVTFPLIGNMSRVYPDIKLTSNAYDFYTPEINGTNLKMAFFDEFTDITNPLVTILDPTNSTYSALPIGLNITLNENGTCNYTLDGGATNISLTANASQTGFTGTNATIMNGQYTIRAYCQDVVGNINNTESRTFSIFSTSLAFCPNILDKANTTYSLANNVNSSGTCFIVTNNNITLLGNGFKVSGTQSANSYAINVTPVTNFTLDNITLTNYSIGFISNNMINSRIINVNSSNHLNAGMDFIGTNKSIIGNITSNYNTNDYGILMQNSFNNNLSAVISKNNGFYSMFMLNSSNNLIRNFTSLNDVIGGIVLNNSNNNLLANFNGMNDSNGISLDSSSNNTFMNGTINASTSDAIFINNNGLTNTTLINITIINTPNGKSDLKFNVAGVNGTTIQDMPTLGTYNFTGTGGKINIVSSNNGKITFLDTINGTGNFSLDIKIGNNTASVNGSKLGLNKSANITFYNIPAFTNPVILRDGVQCPSWVCYNFTALSGTVQFNVTGWSNYSIASGIPLDTIPPNVTNLISLPNSPATYTFGANYTFNATVRDDIAVGTVLLRFNGTNYTATNWTDNYTVSISNLSVGTYSNNCWLTNDTSGNRNDSECFSYTIGQASSIVNLTLNNTDSSITILNGSTILLNGSRVLGDTTATLRLYSNNSLININKSVEVTNLTSFNIPGLYNITVEYVATQNYTRSIKTWFVNVILEAAIPPPSSGGGGAGGNVSYNQSLYDYNQTTSTLTPKQVPIPNFLKQI